MAKEFNKVAIHQVENLLVVEQNQCTKAKEKAISENKVATEIEMWGDMATIYEILTKKLNEMNGSTTTTSQSMEKRVVDLLNNITKNIETTTHLKVIAECCEEIVSIVRNLERENNELKS